MREVEKVATIKSIEQRRGLLNAQTIPPHVRKFGGARKRFDGAGEDAEPAKSWRFFARSKKCLQAETDAKKRLSGVDMRTDRGIQPSTGWSLRA